VSHRKIQISDTASIVFAIAKAEISDSFSHILFLQKHWALPSETITGTTERDRDADGPKSTLNVLREQLLFPLSDDLM